MACGDLLLSPRPQSEQVSLVLTPFVGFDAEQDGRRSTSLGDDEWLLGCPHPLERRRGAMAEVSHGHDVWNHWHGQTLRKCA